MIAQHSAPAAAATIQWDTRQIASQQLLEGVGPNCGSSLLVGARGVRKGQPVKLNGRTFRVLEKLWLRKRNELMPDDPTMPFTNGRTGPAKRYNRRAYLTLKSWLIVPKGHYGTSEHPRLGLATAAAYVGCDRSTIVDRLGTKAVQDWSRDGMGKIKTFALRDLDDLRGDFTDRSAAAHESDPLLTTGELAKELGCDETTIYNLKGRRTRANGSGQQGTPLLSAIPVRRGKRRMNRFRRSNADALKAQFTMLRAMRAQGYFDRADGERIYTLEKASETSSLSHYFLRCAAKKTDLLPEGKLPTVDAGGVGHLRYGVTGSDLLRLEDAVKVQLRETRRIRKQKWGDDRQKWQTASELAKLTGAENGSDMWELHQCAKQWVELGWLESKDVYTEKGGKLKVWTKAVDGQRHQLVWKKIDRLVRSTLYDARRFVELWAEDYLKTGVKEIKKLLPIGRKLKATELAEQMARLGIVGRRLCRVRKAAGIKLRAPTRRADARFYERAMSPPQDDADNRAAGIAPKEPVAQTRDTGTAGTDGPRRRGGRHIIPRTAAVYEFCYWARHVKGLTWSQVRDAAIEVFGEVGLRTKDDAEHHAKMYAAKKHDYDEALKTFRADPKRRGMGRSEYARYVTARELRQR